MMVLKVEGYFAEMSQKVLIFLVVKKKNDSYLHGNLF